MSQLIDLGGIVVSGGLVALSGVFAIVALSRWPPDVVGANAALIGGLTALAAAFIAKRVGRSERED